MVKIGEGSESPSHKGRQRGIAGLEGTDPHLIRAQRGSARVKPAVRNFRWEPFDESSARILCGVKPPLRNFRAI